MGVLYRRADDFSFKTGGLGKDLKLAIGLGVTFVVLFIIGLAVFIYFYFRSGKVKQPSNELTSSTQSSLSWNGTEKPSQSRQSLPVAPAAAAAGIRSNAHRNSASSFTPSRNSLQHGTPAGLSSDDVVIVRIPEETEPVDARQQRDNTDTDTDLESEVAASTARPPPPSLTVPTTDGSAPIRSHSARSPGSPRSPSSLSSRSLRVPARAASPTSQQQQARGSWFESGRKLSRRESVAMEDASNRESNGTLDSVESVALENVPPTPDRGFV